MKVFIRLGLVIIIIVCCIVAIEFKKQNVRDTRAKKVTTILSELMKNGAPVTVSKVEKRDFLVKKKISMTPCGNDYCFSVSRHEFGTIQVGLAIYESNSVKKIGRIIGVSSDRSLADGLFAIKAKINAADHKKSERIVADIDLQRLKDSLVIPRTAVIYEDGQSKVYTIDEEGKPSEVAVQLAENNGYEFRVKSGLVEHQEIITEGETLIKRFKKINVVTEESSK